MKQLKVLNVVVLILMIFLPDCSQEQNKNSEIADDLLIKSIEYVDKKDTGNARDCFKRAVELDPTKSIYNEILGCIGYGEFEKALKLLRERKDKSPTKKELKFIQFLAADTHFRWAKKLERKYDYINAIAHYKVAYGIDIVYRRKQSVIDLTKVGFLYYALGQKQKALEYYEKALPILREVGNRSVEASTINNIGKVYSDLGQKQKALEYYEKALPIFREVRNRSGEATTLNNIGNVFNVLGQRQKALEYFEKALSILREVGNRSVVAATLNNIGSVYNALGQNQKALEYFEKSLPIVRELGDRSGEATTLNNIGKVYSDLGQKQKALELYEKVLLIFSELGNNFGKATTLNNIGKVYSDLGQNQKALEYYEKALPISHQVGNRSGEASTLNNIGSVYDALGQNQKALEYYEKALPIFHEIGNRWRKASTLDSIGIIYYSFGQKQKALEYFEKALPLRRQVGDRSGEANTLDNIGSVYNALGQKQKALEYYEKALPIVREVRDRSGEATTLNNIGIVYYSLGHKQKALEYYEKALPLRRQVRDRSGEATTLNNIGMLYKALGQNRKALEYYKKALPIYTSVGDRSGEATALNNIGLLYSNLDQKRKALEYYEKALPIVCQLRNRSSEAATLNNIAIVYGALGQKQKALEYYEKVLTIVQELGDKENEAALFGNLMAICYEMNKNSLAIFHGKQAVNRLQYLRKSVDKLDIKTKLKYLQSEEDTYRSTTYLLILSGRLGEAQQVLDILKDVEYFSFVRRDRSAYTPQYSPIDYTGFERKWINQQHTLLKKVFSISTPYHELFIKPNKTPEEQKKLGSLKVVLEKVQKEYSDFLDRMKKEFDNYKYKEDPDIEAITNQTAPIQEFLRSLDRENIGKTAALHFLVYKGRISVIITTPTSQTVKHSPSFDDKEFNAMIYNYRDLIEELAPLSRITKFSSTLTSKIDELSRQKRDIENKLYTLIFQPVHQYLKQYGAVNLLISLDGVLRYIPITSLWDGQHYLVQKYRFVLLTPSSLKHIKEKPVIEDKILGMGASKGGKGFTPLLHAGKEIRAIVHDREKGCKGLINGNALIDNDFTRKTMIKRLKTTSYPLVHIATHFKFSPGNETNNQLLLGDGTTMSLSDIRKEGKLFDNVKLLVLSACQTGMGGNGEEIDGFARLAQQCGANSVIASLWSVDDESTKELMVKFYRILKEGKVTSKIEALRLAQLELAGLGDLINESKSNAVTSNTSGKKSDYSNPYYWAPFIMMGNWR